jgi:hypothetical protein
VQDSEFLSNMHLLCTDDFIVANHILGWRIRETLLVQFLILKRRLPDLTIITNRRYSDITVLLVSWTKYLHDLISMWRRSFSRHHHILSWHDTTMLILLSIRIVNITTRTSILSVLRLRKRRISYW